MSRKMTVKDAKSRISNIHLCQETTSRLQANATDPFFQDYFRMVNQFLSFYEACLEEQIENAEL